MNPQREYVEHFPGAPMPPPEWAKPSTYMNGHGPVPWVKHLPGGLVVYEIDVPRTGRIGKMLGLRRYHFRVMDAEGNILVDVPK